jgi:hypothetical protein
MLLGEMSMKITKYIWPIVFLAGFSIGTYYFLIYLDLVTDSEKRITWIFTILGLSFGIFQFWVTEINNKIRRDYELRYEAYKELNKTIQAISEKLNEEMGKDGGVGPHGLVTSLMNLVNQFQDTVKTNDDFLFPGLQHKPGFNALSKISFRILERADKMRKNIEDMQKKKISDEGLNALMVIERMNWHNDTRALLGELHDKKYDFYKEVKGYL